MLGYDYSAGPIAPAALKAVGCEVVFRYVSTPGNPKNITRSEYEALITAGIQVGIVFETTADWALGGFAAGLIAAAAARAQATAVGYPAGHALWYAIDFDTSAAAADITTVTEALHGAAAGSGSAGLVRAYGDYDVVEYAAAAGYSLGWQTVAWSRGRRSGHAAVYQTGQTATCGGVQVDINEVSGPLFPAPVPPKPPAPVPAPTIPEDTMLCVSAPRSADPKALRDIFLLGNGKYTHVTAGAYGGLLAAGVRTAPVDYAQHEEWLTAFGGTAVTG